MGSLASASRVTAACEAGSRFHSVRPPGIKLMEVEDTIITLTGTYRGRCDRNQGA